MKFSHLFSALIFLIVLCFSNPVHANDEDADIAAANGAQLDVRIGALEDQIRALNGRLEESQFQNRKLSEDMEKLRRDTEFRFNEIAQQQQAPAAVDAPQPQAAAPAPQAAAKAEDHKPLAGNKIEVKDAATGASVSQSLPGAKTPPAPVAATAPAATPQATKAAAPAKAEANSPQFANARDHYNYAFRLLNQTKYEEASASFKDFLKAYPKDPLAGNANYWLGETYYIKKDYVTAADNFRQGFESSPNGPKAADNLLKLAMSLNELKHSKEACTVLGQVVSKFGKTATNAAQKATAEQKRIGCQ